MLAYPLLNYYAQRRQPNHLWGLLYDRQRHLQRQRRRQNLTRSMNRYLLMYRQQNRSQLKYRYLFVSMYRRAKYRQCLPILHRHRYRRQLVDNFQRHCQYRHRYRR
jgi:hypothetical protein